MRTDTAAVEMIMAIMMITKKTIRWLMLKFLSTSESPQWALYRLTKKARARVSGTKPCWWGGHRIAVRPIAQACGGTGRTYETFPRCAGKTQGQVDGRIAHK